MTKELQNGKDYPIGPPVQVTGSSGNRIWIDWIAGIGPRLYQVTRSGEVWSVEGERFIRPDLKKKYLEVDLKEEGYRRKVLVHRLVACGFLWLERIEGQDQVDHIDMDTHNNTVVNLEWVNQSENIQRRNASGSDSGGGVSAGNIKCPHCAKWLKITAVESRNG
jgi:hypothetical protein